MSISFMPHAGTYTTYDYYEAEGREYMGGDIVNGVYRSTDTQPSIDCHNSGGHQLICLLELVPVEDRPEAYVGNVHADRIPALLEKVDALRRVSRDEYMERKLARFVDLLLHCKYHACGFGWG